MAVGMGIWTFNLIFHLSRTFTYKTINWSRIFISNGMLFQITAHEYDKLFLNRLIFVLDIKKLLLATERKLDVVSSDIFLIWNKSIKYEGAILLAILYIIFALFKNTKHSALICKFWDLITKLWFCTFTYES